MSTEVVPGSPAAVALATWNTFYDRLHDAPRTRGVLPVADPDALRPLFTDPDVRIAGGALLAWIAHLPADARPAASAALVAALPPSRQVLAAWLLQDTLPPGTAAWLDAARTHAARWAAWAARLEKAWSRGAAAITRAFAALAAEPDAAELLPDAARWLRAHAFTTRRHGRRWLRWQTHFVAGKVTAALAVLVDMPPADPAATRPWLLELLADWELARSLISLDWTWDTLWVQLTPAEQAAWLLRLRAPDPAAAPAPPPAQP